MKKLKEMRQTMVYDIQNIKERKHIACLMSSKLQKHFNNTFCITITILNERTVEHYFRHCVK